MKSSLKDKKENLLLGKVNSHRTGLHWKAASHQNETKLARLHYLALLQAKNHIHQESNSVHMTSSNLSNHRNSALAYYITCIIQHTA